MQGTRICLLTSLITLTVIFSACGGGGGSDSSGTSSPTQLRFAARINGETAECGKPYAGVGLSQATVQIQDFRFYVSDIKLIRSDAQEIPVQLVEDGLWQLENLVLLDFEDATGACAELGTPQTNSVVNFTVPKGDYVGVRFSMSVPFERNHGDSSSAPSPLNLGAMQWNWQAGYKFLRIDLLNDNPAPNNSWFIHIGSTGCQSESSVTAPSVECVRPNRTNVILSEFNPDENLVIVDAGRFLNSIDLRTNTADTLPGCMSTPTDPECPEVFNSLGIDFNSGKAEESCIGCQKLFWVE